MSGDAHIRICERLGVQFPQATRLVICCKNGKAEEALAAMRQIMERLKLTVN